MLTDITESLDWMSYQLSAAQTVEKVGRVVQVTGLIIESEGPDVALGDLCEIVSDRKQVSTTAEVVGFRDNRVLLMPLGEVRDLHAGCRAVAVAGRNAVPTGAALLGRVLDGLGRPMDGLGRIGARQNAAPRSGLPNPMKRQRIRTPFATGVRAIDTFVPLGQGQRLGIFAGSGVGKSTLLGMIARGGQADVNVIALVGERGRELREFIENDLGPEGLARSVLVVSTSDESAPMRLHAAELATRIAEGFRDEGKNVLLLMDSVTRLAMAQREIGLAVGEPPTSRGYTPSVFSLLPRLLERSGMGETGSITAFYTVLVEGDDLNEPVTDAVRGILDGHIVLDRSLAAANHYPAIDVLGSISRLQTTLLSGEELALVSKARDLLTLYKRNEDLINIGAYAAGSNQKLDTAIARHEPLQRFLRQSSSQLSERAESLKILGEIAA
ncbi:MAG: FliI/YscN family ATPase [Opitutales bacterium]